MPRTKQSARAEPYSSCRSTSHRHHLFKNKGQSGSGAMCAHHRRLSASCDAQVTDCMRRGCALPPPTTAFRRRAAMPGLSGDDNKRVSHGAGKVRAVAQCRFRACAIVIFDGMLRLGIRVVAAEGTTCHRPWQFVSSMHASSSLLSHALVIVILSVPFTHTSSDARPAER